MWRSEKLYSSILNDLGKPRQAREWFGQTIAYNSPTDFTSPNSTISINSCKGSNCMTFEEEVIANQKLILTNQKTLDNLLSRLDTVIGNQEIIKENQEIIKVNQKKLDALLANQETIQANQQKILTNQSEIRSLLSK